MNDQHSRRRKVFAVVASLAAAATIAMVAPASASARESAADPAGTTVQFDQQYAGSPRQVNIWEW